MPRKKSEVNVNKTLNNNDKNLTPAFKCWCCGEEYTKLSGNFFPTNFPLFKYYRHYPVCRKCTDAFFIELKDFYDGSEENAVEHICSMYGFFYHPNPLLSALKNNEYKTKISLYVKNISLNPWTGKTWMDTLRIRRNEKKGYIVEEPEKKIITAEMKRFWGVGYREDEYLILQGYYDDYLKNTEGEIDFKTQKQLKILSLTEYQMQKNIQTGKDIGALTNSYKSQFNEIAESNANISNDSFGRWISEIERYCPAEMYKDKKKYHDFFGIIEYIERYMFRPLRNLIFNTKEPEKEHWIPDDTIESKTINNA